MILPLSLDAHTAIEPQIVVAAAAGAVGGAVYYYCLWRSVRLLATGVSATRPFTLQLIRLTLVAAALWLLAVRGVMPLLAAMPGLLAARTIMIRVLGIAP